MLSKYAVSRRVLTSGRSARSALATSTTGVNTSKRHSSSINVAGVNDVHDTVIVGGGIAGVSIAYHLARRGQDVLLLEKTELTAGSTWHAAGLVTLYHPTPNVKKIHYDSMNLYAQITAETGQEVGFHTPGSLRLATSPLRVQESMYALSRQGHKDAPMRYLNPDEVAEKVPILNMDNIYGGLFTPGEGHIDPYSLTQAIAIGARKWGAKILQGTEVTGMQPLSDGAWNVVTPHGNIKANKVVNCSGFWGREVGHLAGHDLPLVPIQHQYLVTKSVPEVQALKEEIPVLRHLDGSFYLRMERDGLLVGPYESEQTMVQMSEWAENGVTPGFGKELYPGDLDRLGPHLEVCMEAFPCFQNAEITTVVNGPITYTPDILPLVGPSMLPNMWLALGFGYGIAHGGGIAKYLASWIIDGEAPQELIEFDPARYGNWTTMDFALAKTRESYGYNTAYSYPFEERKAGRPTKRVNPIQDRLVAAGAQMGFAHGWETPYWFAAPGKKPEYIPSFQRTNWQLNQDREYNVLKTKVGLADLTPFAKFNVTGPDSRRFLDYAVAGTVPKPGKTSLVHMLTPRGKVYAELTITCRNDQSFLVVTGAGSELHDFRELRNILRDMNGDVQITNVTDDIGVLTIAGPKSKDLLATVTDSEVESWKFLEARSAKVGGVDCLAIQISYTGELGWELYVNLGDLPALYDNLLANGQQFGLEHVGNRVINTLRIEKGFRAWGREMNKDVTPVESGLLPFVKFNKKSDFRGKAGLLEHMKKVPERKVVHVKIDAAVTDYEPEGDETVFCEGKAVGCTTSGCWSPILNSGLAMVSVPCLFSTPGTKLQVMLGGIPRDAVVLAGAPAQTYSAIQIQNKNRLKSSLAN